MPQKRVLLVDDEPSILTTFQQILNMSDFDVAVANTVAAGLALIQTQRFDALITDLNIGQPGDGFTLVSAMRRTQPDAVTVIITGFPAFDTALERSAARWTTTSSSRWTLTPCSRRCARACAADGGASISR